MDNFGAYSVYYDLLYRDKKYAAEIDYVLSLADRHHSKPKSILSFGCGTGSYEILLGKKGFEVLGVDLSATMLDEARRKTEQEGLHKSVQFKHSEIAQFKSEKKYDLAISLFHVASYHTEWNAFQQFLKAAHDHLAPGGLFIFDFWYGPCVLSQPVLSKVKRFSDDKYAVTRISEPVLDWAKNTVTVNFDISVEEKSSQQFYRIREQHPMRYFFESEIRQASQENGFVVEGLNEWMTSNPPGLNSFSTVCVLKKG